MAMAVQLSSAMAMQLSSAILPATNRRISRRAAALFSCTPLLLLADASASAAVDFRLTVPEQTAGEAAAAVRGHARDLLNLRLYIERRSWKDLQVALRSSASSLKQDMYTIIQAQPGGRRPGLRKLYSDLFDNAVTLDYAARDMNEELAQQCYNNIDGLIGQFFAMISRNPE